MCGLDIGTSVEVIHLDDFCFAANGYHCPPHWSPCQSKLFPEMDDFMCQLDCTMMLRCIQTLFCMFLCGCLGIEIYILNQWTLSKAVYPPVWWATFNQLKVRMEQKADLP